MKWIAWIIVTFVVYYLLELIGGIENVNGIIAVLAGVGAAVIVAEYQKQH